MNSLSFPDAPSRAIFAAMTQYIEHIVSYFRYLCEQHGQLLHAETPGNRVFEVRSYEQAFGDFRSTAREKNYAVRLILPTFGFDDQGGQGLKKYQVGLLVVKYYSRREDDKNAVITAMSEAEKIGDDFVARIVNDSRNGHPLFYGADSPGAMQIEGDFLDVQGDGSYAGVMYFLNFQTFRGLDALCNDVWEDSGLTPF